MAKWGQGDPRWIVEEREDGTNVNNWHWCGGPRARAGGRAPGRAARRRSTAARGGRRFLTALVLRLQAPPEVGRAPEGTSVSPYRTAVPRSPLTQPSSALRCVVRVRAPTVLCPCAVGRTERDATIWSKGKLRELLVGIAMENEAGRCEISELKQVEGEASCNSRKGKLIFFYEWNIKLAWKGTVKESGAKHKGLIEIPSLSEENEINDTEVNVSKKKGDGEILKDLMRTTGTAKVREALGEYLKALKTEFTTGMILPTKAVATQELTLQRKLNENKLQASPVALGVRIPTVALHLTELFDTTVEQLYSIFTVKELVQKFSKSPAVLEAERGGKFQMFDGNISGEYVELVTNRKIIMKWRCRNWPEEHYATVELNFVPAPGQTELQLDCKGVPVCKEENMKFCWQKQHFEEIKGLLELTAQNA